MPKPVMKSSYWNRNKQRGSSCPRSEWKIESHPNQVIRKREKNMNVLFEATSPMEHTSCNEPYKDCISRQSQGDGRAWGWVWPGLAVNALGTSVEKINDGTPEYNGIHEFLLPFPPLILRFRALHVLRRNNDDVRTIIICGALNSLLGALSLSLLSSKSTFSQPLSEKKYKSGSENW